MDRGPGEIPRRRRAPTGVRVRDDAESGLASPPAEEAPQDITVTEERRVTARHHLVKPGDTFDSIAEEHGVDKTELERRNRKTLSNAAQARGFDAHVFYRHTKDELGRLSQPEPDYHVFAGEVLELRDPEEGEPGHPDFIVG